MKDSRLVLRISSDLKAQLEQEASARGLSLGELVCRRCRQEDVPPNTYADERVRYLILNGVERISRDIRRGKSVSADQIQLVEGLRQLVMLMGATSK